MTRDEARKLLEDNKTLEFGGWYFTSVCMGCGGEDNCCYENFNSVDEALNAMASMMTFTRYTWDDVQENSI